MKILRLRLVVVLVMTLGAGLALAMWTHARAQDSHSRAGLAYGGMGGGMMGGGMMRGGMMGGGMAGGGMMGGGMMGGNGSRNAQPSAGDASTPGWDDLSGYIRSKGLACMSCHALSARSTGPAFLDIAHRFSGHANAEDELASAIRNGVSGKWSGYPPMPAGLATPNQAVKLARLIVRLTR